ncbi:MAG: FkbM family methyltransferase [Sphingomonas sp.]|uniref:FkbM family methyltransferase n=1 Tax=Sphingomonas sp. TaxID=28214 RepID=UPI001ACBACA4|nr:FkbM family methyltransferase [Sphingomonas sp.]MBN8807735.1 FkbM family methyltransferase [Sphingomonas sp.]
MLKRMLAGTGLGSAAVRLRDRWELVRSAFDGSLEIGDRRNNSIASQLITHLRTPGKTFVDVGAHIGSVLGEVARNSRGKVIAFEAIPAKAVHLRRKFPTVTVHNVALLDRDGETRFFIDNAQSGYSSLSQRQGDVTEIVVPVARMDAFITEDDVDVIKIDVEGAELGVLRGAEGVIARCRPVVMFESGPGDVLGYTKEAMWRWFDERDYRIYFPDRISRAARAATLDVFIDSHEYPRRSMNYFAIPAERMDEIAARAREILHETVH